MKRAWMGAAVLGVVLTSGTAFAQEIPVPAWAPAAGAEDVVVLKDGGAVRGTVMEVLPNDHVSVKLADGRTAIITWSVVHHIEQAAKPAAPATAPTTTPQVVPQAPAPVQAATGSVRVTMEGDNDAVLEQEHNGAWNVVCSGACNASLPLEPAYRVTGSGVRTSGAFRLLGKSGDRITLHLNTGSSAGFTGGVTLALVGGLAATIGFWGALVASSNNDQYAYDDYEYEQQQRHQISVVPWVVTGLIGAAVGTLGLVMAVSNEKTKVNQTASTEKTAKAAASLFTPKTASNIPDRVPTWANANLVGAPATNAGTIFSFKF